MSFAIFRTEVASTDDTGPIQTGKALGYKGEEFDGAPIIRQHGFASHAPKGSHGHALAARGERTLVALLGLEHQDKRPRNLGEGNTVIYDVKNNVSRYLGDDGIWHDAGSRPQKMTGKTITIEATDTLICKVGDMLVKITSSRIDLGGEGGSPVMTQAGASSKVFAVT